MLIAGIRLGPFDDQIQMVVDLNDAGGLLVIYTFDCIEYSGNVLKLVNHFNSCVGFLKAFISKGSNYNYLKLEYSAPICKTIDEECEHVLKSLREVKYELVLKIAPPAVARLFAENEQNILLICYHEHKAFYESVNVPTSTLSLPRLLRNSKPG